MWDLGGHKRITLGLFALIIALKISFLLAYGPIHTPDSGGYWGHADIILGQDTSWLTSVNLDKPWQPETAFRILGYPAVIAVLKSANPQNWDWILVIAQMGVSLLATLFLTRLAYLWSGGKPWIAYTVAIGHALGQGWVLDQCVLTDSFNASLWLIAASTMALGILEQRPPTYAKILMLGMMVLFAFLMREAGNVLQVLLWPLVLYWAMSTGSGKRRAALMLCVFALPMFIGTGAYKSWNQMRTGERFITTGGQTTLYIPTLRLQARGIDPFAGSIYLSDMPPLQEPISSRTPLQHIHQINTHLHEQHAMNALDIANYGYTTFFRLWSEQPLGMVRGTLSQLREKIAMLAFMPVEASVQLRMWARWDTNWKQQNGLMKAGRHISRGISIIIMAAFIFGMAKVVWNQVFANRAVSNDVQRSERLMILLSVMYLGYTFSYAMVSLETRYLMPVEPFSAVIGLLLLDKARQRLPKGIWANVWNRR